MAEVNIYPWGNDEAADWFHEFWKADGGMQWVIDTIADFTAENEEYDSVRAACHVLYCFGSSYAFPIAQLDCREDIIEKGISILENMINPPSDEWNYLENCGHDKKIIADIERQITELKFILTQ